MIDEVVPLVYLPLFLSSCLAVLLCHRVLFQTFLSNSSVPNERQITHIVQIFSSGSSSEVAIYRPISRAYNSL